MLRLNVEGMTCSHCAQSVTRALNGIDPHAEVRVDLASKTVEADTDADPKTVLRAIEDAGYRALAV